MLHSDQNEFSDCDKVTSTVTSGEDRLACLAAEIQKNKSHSCIFASAYALC